MRNRCWHAESAVNTLCASESNTSFESEVARRVESDQLSVRALIEESNPEILEEHELRALGFDCGMFANLNTPEEWKKHLRNWS